MVRAVPLLLIGLSFAATSTSSLRAAEPALVLELQSGRRFAGEVDGQTGDESLVLRASKGGMTIRRPIRWERIVSATLEGQAIEIDELKVRAAAVRVEIEDRGQESGVRSQGSGIRGQESVPEPVLPPKLARVTTLTFDARIANWDGDVETDGLILELMPLDLDGYIAAVSGTVEIELFAPQRRVFHHAPLSGGDTLELVERWTRSIRAADFGPGGIRLRLPFGAVHPEFDSDWLASHYGLVHVRLAAPGHGTFDDSQDGLRIRPWAPNRDQLELNEGRRFLPTEAVGRSPESIGGRN